jgi:hypothetical protein
MACPMGRWSVLSLNSPLSPTLKLTLIYAQPYAGRTDLGGDTAYALPPVDTWRQWWAQRAGCNAPSSGNMMAPSVITSNYLGLNVTMDRWNCPRATIVGYTAQTMAHFWLTKGGGYWDVTPVNVIAFFNARPQGRPTGA